MLHRRPAPFALLAGLTLAGASAVAFSGACTSPANPCDPGSCVGGAAGAGGLGIAGTGGAGGAGLATQQPSASANITSSSQGPSTTGGPVDYTAGWKRMEGVDPCEVWIPASEEARPRVTWTPCADGAPGCKDLATEWHTQGDYVMLPVVDGRAGVVAFHRVLDDNAWTELNVGFVEPTKPLASFAIRMRNLLGVPYPICAIGSSSIGPKTLSLGLLHLSGNPSTRIEHQLSVASESGEATIIRSFDSSVLHGNSSQERSIGPNLVAFRFVPGSILHLLTLDGATFKQIAAMNEGIPWQPLAPTVVGDDVYFEALHVDGGQVHLYRHPSEERKLVLERPGGDVYSFEADGERMVWFERTPSMATSKPAETLELWQSPMATSPAEVKRTKIADLSPRFAGDYLRLESGYVLFREATWNRNIVLRLSDLHFWDLRAPAGEAWGDTLYLAPDEVAIALQREPYLGSSTYTIRRIRLDALPPPKPLAELKPTDEPLP